MMNLWKNNYGKRLPTKLEALIGSKNRIKNIANDIVTHFSQRQEVFAGKAMIVAMSQRIAAELYQEIINLKPDWHSDDLNHGKLKVVMTSASSYGEQIAKHHTTKQQRRIVIVRDIDFDAPSMHTLSNT
ncbi:MAG: hypothetical protein RLZZ293_275, partial [Pseudomonadota bacterium]